MRPHRMIIGPYNDYESWVFFEGKGSAHVTTRQYINARVGDKIVTRPTEMLHVNVPAKYVVKGDTVYLRFTIKGISSAITFKVLPKKEQLTAESGGVYVKSE